MRATVSVLSVLMMLPEIARAQPGPGPGPAPAPPAPYPGQPNPGQPYQGQPNPAQPYQGQPNPAQPYPGQPYPGQPYPGQPYPGQPYPGQPYPGQYPPPYGGPPPLTPDEQRLLAEGEISPGEIVGGVVGNWVLGFGLGHAIQGRWSDRGWVFTLGESASLILLFVGLAQSSGESGDSGDVSIATGAIGWGVFRIWSIFDAAIGPSSHNSKVRDVKRRIGLPVDARRIIPYVAPGRERGGVAGLTFRF